MKKQKKVLKKKPLKKKIVKPKEEEYDDEWEFEVGGSEEPRRLKPLRLRIVSTNKYDIIVQDIDTKYMYAVEKYYNAFIKGFEYGLKLLGV